MMEEEEPLTPEEYRVVEQAIASGQLTGEYRTWAMAQAKAYKDRQAAAPAAAEVEPDAGAPPADEQELPPMGPPLPPDYGYEQDAEEEEEVAGPVGGEPLTPEEQAQYGIEPDAAPPAAQPDNPNAQYNELYGFELDPNIPIDPRLPITPQVLAMTPATNHELGDDAARHEWLNGNIQGDAVIFFEPPVEVARRKLMESPELVKMLLAKAKPPDPVAELQKQFAQSVLGPNAAEQATGGHDYVANPELLTQLSEDDPLYQAFADWEYTNAIGNATKAGRAAYRASKAPWLFGGKTQSVLETLGMKLNAGFKQGAEGLEAFVLGVDDAGMLRLGRRTHEVIEGDDPQPTFSPAVGKHTGGIPAGETAASRNHMLVEEYPELFSLGQAYGSFAPWTLVGKTFNAIAKGAPTMSPMFRGAAKAGAPPRPPPQPLSLGKQGLVAGGTGAMAATGLQTAQEGIDAAANLALTDGESTGTTLEDAGQRIAGAFGVGFGGGVLGELAGLGANKYAEFVRHGDYFGQRPGLVEDLRGQIKFGRGPVKPKEVDAIERRARGMTPRAKPVDVVAQEIAPHIEDAVEQYGLAAQKRVQEAVEKYQQSPEGQMKLPLKNFVGEATKVLREIYTQVKPTGGLRPVGLKGAGKDIKDAWNQAVVRISPTNPKTGGIALKPREALAFMDADKREELAAQIGLGAGQHPDGEFLAAFKEKGIKELWAHPAPLDAEHTETVFQVLKGYSGANPHDRFMQRLDGAARVDRDARPMGGRRGAWSELQGQHSKILGEAEELAKEAAPRGRAFKALVNAATDKEGQVFSRRALQRMAEDAGVGDRFRTLMLLDPLRTLRNEAIFGHHRNAYREAMPSGLVQIGDFVQLRGLYPGAKAIEGARGPIRGGMGGRIGGLIDDPDTQDEAVARIRKALSQQAAQQGNQP